MRSPNLIFALVAVAASAGAHGLRVTKVDPLFEQRRTVKVAAERLKSPGPKVLRLMSMNHHTAWANLFWIDSLQEFAHDTPESLDRIKRWTDIATDLDPKFFIPYYATAIAFMTALRYQEADEVLDKAMLHIKDRHEFPFLKGYNAYFGFGLPDEASKWWLEAGKFPRAPTYMVSLAARAKFHAGDERAAEKLLIELIPNLPPRQRGNAELRLMLIRSEYILREYDAACISFRDTNGRNPKDGQELFDAGLVTKPPVDLHDGPIEIDHNCRARTKLLQVREDEARERVGSQGPQGPGVP